MYNFITCNFFNMNLDGSLCLIIIEFRVSSKNYKSISINNVRQGDKNDVKLIECAPTIKESGRYIICLSQLKVIKLFCTFFHFSLLPLVSCKN